MPYLLLTIVAIVALAGMAKVTRTAQPGRTPWGSLLLWAILFVAGLSIWLMSVRSIH